MRDKKIVRHIKLGFALVNIEMLVLGILSYFVISGTIDFSGNRAEQMRGHILVLALILMAVGAALATVNSLVKNLKGPLENLKQAAGDIAVGNIQTELVKKDDDEIGEVIDEFQKMIINIQDQADIAKSISEGNLDLEVVPNSDEDVMGNALKRLVDVNNKVLSGINESSMQLTSGAAQVASASQALAQGSTEQASAIEEITASMEDIARKTGENASKSSEAAQLVHSVGSGIAESNTDMQNMILAMDHISDSSHRISKVIKVIDDIAFQTNILALNATVEAARAGTHGKGFAVVAEEVKNLAEKSASAAADTAELIQTSIEKVEKRTDMAARTAESLEKIVDQLDQVVGLIDQIAGASNDQATAVSQMNQAMTQVSQVVQNNSATSEQCASASEELANQSQTLREMIARYRLRSTGGQYE